MTSYTDIRRRSTGICWRHTINTASRLTTALRQRYPNAGPASQTLGQHWTSVEHIYSVHGGYSATFMAGNPHLYQRSTRGRPGSNPLTILDRLRHFHTRTHHFLPRLKNRLGIPCRSFIRYFVLFICHTAPSAMTLCFYRHGYILPYKYTLINWADVTE